MSVTTLGPVNLEQLHAALPGHVFAASGDLTQAGATIWAPNGDVTDAQISTALAGITYKAPAAQTALTGIQTLLGQQTALTTQLQADISTVQTTGWDALTAQQRTDIIVRILQEGLGNAMQAIVDHLTVSGIT